MKAISKPAARCKCAPDWHPQTPPKVDREGRPVGVSVHHCGTCGTEWKYGTAAPVCLGVGTA